MATNTKVDVFPNGIAENVTLLPIIRNPKTMIETCLRDLYPFVATIDHSNRVYFYPVLVKQQTRKHFGDTLQNLHSDAHRPPMWDSIVKRLSKPMDHHKKNCDVRMGFKFQGTNFLVKPCFTFGTRQVDPGTNHIYQIGPVKMALYILDNKFQSPRTLKTFKSDDQLKFTYKTLEANEKYRLKEGMFYVITTSSRSFFSVSIVSSDASLPFPTIDPVITKKRPSPRDIYKQPIQTPLIENVSLDSDDEEFIPPKKSRHSLKSTSAKGMPPPASQPSTSAEGRMPPASQPSTTMPPPAPTKTPLAPTKPAPTKTPLAPTKPAPTKTPLPSTQSPELEIVKTNFTNVPLQKSIQIVNPNIVEWYQALKFKRYEESVKDFTPYPMDEDAIVLDLAPERREREEQAPQVQDRPLQVEVGVQTSPLPTMWPLEQVQWSQNPPQSLALPTTWPLSQNPPQSLALPTTWPLEQVQWSQDPPQSLALPTTWPLEQVQWSQETPQQIGPVQQQHSTLGPHQLQPHGTVMSEDMFIRDLNEFMYTSTTESGTEELLSGFNLNY